MNRTKSYGFKSRSGPLRAITSHTFDIPKRYTQVKPTTQANIVTMMELNENLLEKMKRQCKENLAMRKNILEGGAAI